MQICWDKYLAQVTCLFECTKSFVSSRLRSYCRFPFVIWTFLTVRGRCHGVLNTQRSLQQNCNLIWKRKIFRLESNQSWPLYPQRQALGSLLLECHGLFSPFIPRTCPLRRRTMLWLQWRGRLRLTWIYTRVTILKGLWPTVDANTLLLRRAVRIRQWKRHTGKIWTTPCDFGYIRPKGFPLSCDGG